MRIISEIEYRRNYWYVKAGDNSFCNISPS
jgi:hypothetical protein